MPFKKYEGYKPTATATLRVQEDIVEQIGTNLIPIRGQLMRPNIRLFVVHVQSEDEKFFWLAKHLPKLERVGIVYTGTQANTDIFSNWLQFLNFKSTAYSGRLDAASRMRIESDFINNKYDCVVSTNALGMGIDKPDIRYIIHTQVPQSPIHYYQEIGRAGRDGLEAFAILLYNPNEDNKLPIAFIVRETFFPELEVKTTSSNIINGVAASYYGVSNVGATIRHSKYEGGGDFPDWLLKLTLKAFRKYYNNKSFDLILYVPPSESGDLVKNFAEKISRTLNIPISHNLIKVEETLPQKSFQSAISKKDNVKGKFVYQNPKEIEGKSILLIDDIFDSGYTIKEIGVYLTKIGATTIAPLVIAKTVGGDI